MRSEAASVYTIEDGYKFQSELIEAISKVYEKFKSVELKRGSTYPDDVCVVIASVDLFKKESFDSFRNMYPLMAQVVLDKVSVAKLKDARIDKAKK